MFNDNMKKNIYKKRNIAWMIFSIVGLIIGLITFIKFQNFHVILVALIMFLTSLASYYENEFSLKKEFWKKILFSVIGTFFIIFSSLLLKNNIGILIGISFIIIDFYKIVKSKQEKNFKDVFEEVLNLKIFESIINKIMEPKVDYSKLDIKEYALKFRLLYEQFKVCDDDEKTGLKNQIFDLMNIWMDKNNQDKNLTYATIIIFTDNTNIKSLESLMKEAENQIAEDENHVDWFKKEAQKNIKYKLEKGNNILDFI